MSEHYLQRFSSSKEIILPGIDRVDFKTEILEGVKPEAYHTLHDHVSSSGLKEICISPRHFLQKLYDSIHGEDEGPEPDHFRIGRIAHMMLLEPAKFKQNFVVMPDFGKMQIKANRESKAKFLADLPEGAIGVSEAESNALTCMVESIMSHTAARKALESGVAEASLYWQDRDTKISCRARPDFIGTKDRWLIDFKTTRDSSAGLFAKSIIDYRYDLQLAFYYDAVKEVTGQEPEAAVIISVEKTPPFDCSVYMLDENLLERGRQWYKFGLHTLKKCIETGRWPGRQGRAQLLHTPRSADYDMFPEFEW